MLDFFISQNFNIYLALEIFFYYFFERFFHFLLSPKILIILDFATFERSKFLSCNSFYIPVAYFSTISWEITSTIYCNSAPTFWPHVYCICSVSKFHQSYFWVPRTLSYLERVEGSDGRIQFLYSQNPLIMDEIMFVLCLFIFFCYFNYFYFTQKTVFCYPGFFYA